MDFSFERIGRRRLRTGARHFDYVRLLSSVAAAQAGSRTAAIEARLSVARLPTDSPVAALARLFDPSFGWVAGVGALGGSFHPALAHGRKAVVEKA